MFKGQVEQSVQKALREWGTSELEDEQGRVEWRYWSEEVCSKDTVELVGPVRTNSPGDLEKTHLVSLGWSGVIEWMGHKLDGTMLKKKYKNCYLRQCGEKLGS